MAVSPSDLATGALSALIITLGLFYLLQAAVVYRSLRHESFAFAGMALCFGVYLLLQPVAFRQSAEGSLPWLRLRMMVLAAVLAFLAGCVVRVFRPGGKGARWLPLLPLLPLVLLPFDFYISLPVRLELVRFFGEVLPFRAARARPGLYCHFAFFLLTGVALLVAVLRTRDRTRRFFLTPLLLPFAASGGDLLTGVSRFGPLMITEAALFAAFLSLVAGFLRRDRALHDAAQARRIDLERKLDTANRELTRYRNSSLTGEQAEEGITALETLMRKERVYADHNLTLPLLARRAGLSPHHLSQIINDRTGMNFNRYVNGYRVEEACRVLEDAKLKHLTMDQVCDRTGFNSLSVFNAVFKEITGMTPSAWRRARTP